MGVSEPEYLLFPSFIRFFFPPQVVQLRFRCARPDFHESTALGTSRRTAHLIEIFTTSLFNLSVAHHLLLSM